MNLRVVLADQSEARFYDALTPTAPLAPAGGLQDPKTRQHDRDFNTDRPGRRAASGGASGTIRSATDGDRSPREHEAEQFARQVTHELDRAHQQGSFQHLVLVAPPTFLGMLREALPKSLQGIVTEEINKDLLHEPVESVRDYLTDKSLGTAAWRD